MSVGSRCEAAFLRNHCALRGRLPLEIAVSCPLGMTSCCAGRRSLATSPKQVRGLDREYSQGSMHPTHLGIVVILCDDGKTMLDSGGGDQSVRELDSPVYPGSAAVGY
jgi:hypothetical protein